MKRMTAKLTGAFVLLLLLAATVTMASSHTNRKVTPIDKKTGAERNKAIAELKKAGTEPEALELRCRGGSTAAGGGAFLAFETVGSRVSSSGETILSISLRFMGTAVWADQEFGTGGRLISDRHWDLGGSKCTWIDSSDRGPYRPLSPEEPREIRFETPANAQLKQQLHGTPVDTSPTAAERYPDAQSIPAYMKLQNHYWSFFVENTNQSYFLASRHKYWKAGLEVVRPVDSKHTNKDNPYVLAPKKPD
jgi:hypothetical protein